MTDRVPRIAARTVPVEGSPSSTAERVGALGLVHRAIAGLVLLALLRFAAPLLVPIAAAGVLWLLFWPAAEGLVRRRVPGPVAAAVVAFLPPVLVGAAAVLALPAAIDASQAVVGSMRHLADLLGPIASRGGSQGAAAHWLASHLAWNGDAVSAWLQARAPEAALGTVSALMLLFFLLLGQRSLGRGVLRALADLQARRRLVDGIEEARQGVVAFLGVMGLMNAALAAATGVALAAIGLSHPAFWAVLCFALVFVPYLGPLAVAALLLVAGSEAFGAGLSMFLPAAAFLGLHAVEANFLTPWLMGNRLRLGRPALLVSVMTGAWVWGVVGGLLGVPLLIVLAAAVRRTPGAALPAALLAAEDAPSEGLPVGGSNADGALRNDVRVRNSSARGVAAREVPAGDVPAAEALAREALTRDVLSRETRARDGPAEDVPAAPARNVTSLPGRVTRLAPRAHGMPDAVRSSRPMRIAFVTETYPPEINGVALTVARAIGHLRAQGHEVDLIRPRQRDEARGEKRGADAGDSEWRSSGWPIPVYPAMRFGLARPATLAKRFQATGVELVHVATEGPLGWAAVEAANRLGLPVTSDFRTNFHQYSKYYRLGWLEPVIGGYLRRLHNRTARSFAPTRQTCRELGEAGFERVELAGRGVDLDRFSPARRDPALRARWGAVDEAPVLLHVGRLAPEKNVELALQAFRSAVRLAPSTRMVVVGDGPLRSRLQREHPDALFVGTQTGDALAAHYASADVFLFPSLSDTFGNVTLEALASGLPVVAFDVAAASDLVVDGVNGRTVMPGNRAAFVVAACLLGLRHPGLQPMREAARRTAAALDWHGVLRRFEQQLQGTIDTHRHVAVAEACPA